MIFNNFNFCILKNPFSKEKKDIIFITFFDQKHPVEDVVNNDNYDLLTSLLVDTYNMNQVDLFAFTYPDNINSQLNIKKELELKYGLNYDIEFENNMKNYFLDIESQMNSSGIIQNKKAGLYSIQDSLNQSCEIPKSGEKITLFFYLFLKATFTSENNCLIEFTGDFMSKDDEKHKTYIKILKCDFIRIDDGNYGEMTLQSTKTFKQILQNIPINFNGSFDMKYPIMKEPGDAPIIKTVKYIYNFFDINKNLGKDVKMIIEANEKQYKYLIDLSRKIKRELKQEKHNTISVKSILNSIESVKKNIAKRMQELSDEELYEEAIVCKDNIKKLNDLAKKLKEKKQKLISEKEYQKISCLLK